MSNFNLYQGNCLEILRTMSDNSIDSVVCDPPYGLGKNIKKTINECVW